ncbi:MAG: archaetidylserine decarboxylase [Myxococcota bacterium]
MKDALIVSALSVIPKNRVTRWMGSLARTRFPRAIHRAFIRWYCKKYGVDLAECDADLDRFAHFTEFFTRPLLPGLRPIDPDPRAVVSPCDGKVYAVGDVEDGRIFQSERFKYAASELLGGDTRYDDGQYAVLYLSPRDYHRVHTPREGRVVRYTYRPGRLWPVFPAATQSVEALFAVNERLTTWLETDLGEVAVVMVGAFGVGRIRVVYDDVVSNQGLPATDRALPSPLELGRSAELGRFEMGSTVILLFRKSSVRWRIRAGDPVRVGQAIADALQN